MTSTNEAFNNDWEERIRQTPKNREKEEDSNYVNDFLEKIRRYKEKTGIL